MRSASIMSEKTNLHLYRIMGPLETSSITFGQYIARWELESHSVHDEGGFEGQHQGLGEILAVFGEATHSD